ncbi:DoxX family membrane protein [Gordonia shandongensis]|uniref:DoxX family membrane protein n=1 Tax=Gordonia shandongensis TaxID=376351 RepID=UPI0004168E54|nr:DoxX family membrane protein [Gordonia shandongensis]
MTVTAHSVLGTAGRLLTGVPLMMFGYEAASDPGPRVGMAAPLLDKMREVVPVPVDNETIVRANGAAQVVGGALIASGVAPVAGAGLIAGSLIPTTAAGHAYWEMEDPAMRNAHKTHFRKNIVLIGAALSAAAAASRIAGK